MESRSRQHARTPCSASHANKSAQDVPPLGAERVVSMARVFVEREREFILRRIVGDRVGRVPPVTGVADVVDPKGSWVAAIVVRSEWRNAQRASLTPIILEMASTRRGSACCPKIVAIATSRAVRSSWRGAYQQTLGLAFSGRIRHGRRTKSATLADLDRVRQHAKHYEPSAHIPPCRRR